MMNCPVPFAKVNQQKECFPDFSQNHQAEIQIVVAVAQVVQAAIALPAIRSQHETTKIHE